MEGTSSHPVDSTAGNVMTGASGGVLNLLWDQDDLDGQTQLASSARYVLYPNQVEPRLILPTRPHAAAGVILTALRDRTSFAARLRTQVARVALATGTRAVRLPEPAILRDLVRHLPTEEYVFGVHLGPPRANRKPVVALATTSGRLTAFAKCGVDQLSDRLVRCEIDALASLGELRSVRVPALIGSGTFADHPYVVQAPVPTRGTSRLDDAVVVTAQVEVASVGRNSIDVDEALDAVTDRWRRRASAPDVSGVERGFAAVAEQWARAARQTTVPWGSWHGDWRRTNMATDADGCSVWDWERFATGVPAGYDALHLFLTSRVPFVSELASLPDDLYDNATPLLRPFGVLNQAAADLVTTGYLLELAGRYLDDDQTGAGARLGPVGEWLLPTLTSRAALQPSPSTRPGANES